MGMLLSAPGLLCGNQVDHLCGQGARILNGSFKAVDTAIQLVQGHSPDKDRLVGLALMKLGPHKRDRCFIERLVDLLLDFCCDERICTGHDHTKWDDAS